MYCVHLVQTQLTVQLAYEWFYPGVNLGSFSTVLARKVQMTLAVDPIEKNAVKDM